MEGNGQEKTELGNKINLVQDTILTNDLGEQTSQESFEKTFKPITTKLDDVTLTGLRLPAVQRKRANQFAPVDYGVLAGDDEENPDYGLNDLFDEDIQPEQNKQLVPKLPTYEESLADVLDGEKQIYIDPQYLPEEPQDLPPEYNEEEVPDYALDQKDRTAEILKDLDIIYYDNVEKILNQPEITPQKTKTYIKKVIQNANIRRNQFKGLKTQITKSYKKGEIGEAQRALKIKE